MSVLKCKLCGGEVEKAKLLYYLFGFPFATLHAILTRSRYSHKSKVPIVGFLFTPCDAIFLSKSVVEVVDDAGLQTAVPVVRAGTEPEKG